MSLSPLTVSLLVMHLHKNISKPTTRAAATVLFEIQASFVHHLSLTSCLHCNFSSEWMFPVLFQWLSTRKSMKSFKTQTSCVHLPLLLNVTLTDGRLHFWGPVTDWCIEQDGKWCCTTTMVLVCICIIPGLKTLPKLIHLCMYFTIFAYKVQASNWQFKADCNNMRWWV